MSSENEERLYLIKSIKHTVGDLMIWWGPDDRGYTCFVECAGRYTPAQIAANRGYYDNGESTKAIPLADVLAVSLCVVPTHEAAAIIGKPQHHLAVKLWEQRSMEVGHDLHEDD